MKINNIFFVLIQFFLFPLSSSLFQKEFKRNFFPFKLLLHAKNSRQLLFLLQKMKRYMNVSEENKKKVLVFFLDKYSKVKEPISGLSYCIPLSLLRNRWKSFIIFSLDSQERATCFMSQCMLEMPWWTKYHNTILKENFLRKIMRQQGLRKKASLPYGGLASFPEGYFFSELLSFSREFFYDGRYPPQLNTIFFQFVEKFDDSRKMAQLSLKNLLQMYIAINQNDHVEYDDTIKNLLKNISEAIVLFIKDAQEKNTPLFQVQLIRTALRLVMLKNKKKRFSYQLIINKAMQEFVYSKIKKNIFIEELVSQCVPNENEKFAFWIKKIITILENSFLTIITYPVESTPLFFLKAPDAAQNLHCVVKKKNSFIEKLKEVFLS